MEPRPHPPNPNPSTELLLSGPRCRGRVLALTLADEPGAALLRWFGGCGVCGAKVLMTASRDAGEDDAEVVG